MRQQFNCWRIKIKTYFVLPAVQLLEEGAPMPARTDFPSVFEHLKKILKPYAPKLTVKMDNQNVFYLDGPYSETMEEGICTSVRRTVKKNYVSFYLMPVYMYPDLLERYQPRVEKTHAREILLQLQTGRA
jgi:hypothetical protein